MNWNFDSIVSAIGGGLVFLFLLYNLLAKLFSNFGVFNKYKKKKERAIKDARMEEIREMSEIVVRETIAPLITTVDHKIKEIGSSIEDIKSEMIELKNTDIDSLRGQITEIYTRYLPYRMIPAIEKESCSKLVSRYFKLGGNLYVESIWKEMQNWKTVSSEAEIFERKVD
jgi:hypothetical protein